MEKAHLYETILLVNPGIDEAVHGLERLRRLKDSRLSADYFDQRLVLFEELRAQLNAYFCNNVGHSEELDASRFEKRYDEYRKQSLDEVQVYRDVQAVEQQRRAEGRPPKARFLSDDEQRAYDVSAKTSPGTSEDYIHEGDRLRG